jgi:hypothetical protein
MADVGKKLALGIWLGIRCAWILMGFMGSVWSRLLTLTTSSRIRET